MKKLTDPDTQLSVYQVKFSECEGKQITVVDWVPVWSEKYKTTGVYVYAVSDRGKDILLSTTSKTIYRWCLLHKPVLPCTVMCIKEGKEYRFKSLPEGGAKDAGKDKAATAKQS